MNMLYAQQFKIILIIALFLLCFSVTHGQAPDTLWTKTYGGIDYDHGFDVQQTNDGSYIIVGRTYSFGAGYRDIYLVRADGNGNLVWYRTYGGDNTDDGFSVKQTADSGYVVVGDTRSFGIGTPNYNVWLLKIDTNGDTLWTKTYGGTEDDGARDMGLTSDGGFIIAGSSSSYGNPIESDLYLLKTAGSGDTLWTRVFGVDGISEWGESVQQIHDGGYIIAGKTTSFISRSVSAYVVRTDSLGDTVWTRTFPDCQANCVIQAIDSCFVVAGGSSHVTLHETMWLVKLALNGDTVWVKTYGDTPGAMGNSICETSDGGYIISGIVTTQVGLPTDIYLVRTDKYGDSLWAYVYGGEQQDIGESVQGTADRGYIVAGYTASYGAGGGDMYLIKLAPDTLGTLEQKTSLVKNEYLAATIFRGALLLPAGIQCRVFDITGRVVAPYRTNPGIYFIKVDGKIAQKVVKVR